MVAYTTAFLGGVRSGDVVRGGGRVVRESIVLCMVKGGVERESCIMVRERRIMVKGNRKIESCGWWRKVVL